MATRLFLRDTTANTAGYAATEKSTVLPVGTSNQSGVAARDLDATAGTSGTSQTLAALAQTTHQDGYFRKFISAPLGVTSITAQTWTLGVSGSEANAAANAFIVCSVYVLKSDDTVRGFVYDSDTPLGTEFGSSTQGRVVTFSGASVASVVSTDRLVLEYWIHSVQSMGVAYDRVLAYNGTTDIVDGVANNDAASYLETPQNALFGAGTNYDETGRVITITATPATADLLALGEAGRLIATTAALTATDQADLDEAVALTIAATLVATDDLIGGSVNYDETGRVITITATLVAADSLSAVEPVAIVVTTTLIATSQADMNEAAVVTAATTLAAMSSLSATEPTALTIAAALVASDLRSLTEGPAIAGAVALTATDLRALTEAAVLAVAATLTAAEQLSLTEATALAITAALAATSRQDMNEAGLVPITATLTATDETGGAFNEMGRLISVAATLAATDSLALAEALSVVLSATLAATDARSGSENVILQAAATVSGTASWTGQEAGLIPITATLTGTDDLAAGNQEYDETGRLIAATATLTATSTLAASEDGTINVVVTLEATDSAGGVRRPQVVHGAYGTLRLHGELPSAATVHGRY